MVSRTFKRHEAEIVTGVVSEGCIRGLRKALHADDRVQRGYSHARCNVTTEEVEMLVTLVCKLRPRIGDAQAAKGIAGKERKGNPFDAYQQEVLDSFSHFSLLGFADISENPHLSFYVPLYRVHSTHGKFFNYHASSWQSGSVLEIAA